MNKYLFFLALLLITKSGSAQYCTPVYSNYSMTSGAMSGFALAGVGATSVNDVLPSSVFTTGYTNRIPTVSAVSLMQGNSYSCTVTYFAAASHTGNQVWIDFNDDGVFDTLTENVTPVFPSVPDVNAVFDTASYSVQIPIGATLGTHRMRVRNAWYSNGSYTRPSTSLDPCHLSDNTNTYYDGVTADYSVTIVALPVCSGAPVAGTVSGPASVCSGNPFTLSQSGGTIAGGLVFQWYSSPSGAGTFSPVAGATATSYTVGGLSAAIDYKLKATCTASTFTDSTPIFTVNLNSFYDCYCTAVGGYAYDAPLDSVAINGTTLNNYTPGNINLYTSFPDTGSATASLMQGLHYLISVSSEGYSAYNAYAWIDYDHSGSYDAAECTFIAVDAAPGSASNELVLPGTGLTGLTGMRIRTINEAVPMGGGDACANEASGETEDFLVNIIPTVFCSGHPLAGTAAATSATVCPAKQFTISDDGYSLMGGIGLQWYSSPAGAGTYTPISGATNAVYTLYQAAATDYIFVVHCAASGMDDTSNVITIAETPFYRCYCAPLTGSVLNDDASHASFSDVAILGTSLNNSTSLGGDLYEQYYPYTGTTSALLQQGDLYTMRLISAGTVNYNAAMWIDYDHNGLFDDYEYTAIANDATADSVSFASFYVPVTALTGITGMRIRLSQYSYSMGAADACTEEFYGTTADYIVKIMAGVSCSGAPSAGTAFATVHNTCKDVPFSIVDSDYTNAVGITYQWISAPLGSGEFTPIAGATAPSYTVLSQASSSSYAFVVSCSNSGISDTSAVISVIQNPFYLCYCSPLTGTILGAVSSAVADSVSILSSLLNVLTPASPGGYFENYPATPGTLYQGGVYILAVKSLGTESYDAAAWIDYNHNSTFDVDESIGLLNNIPAGTAGTAVFTVSASSFPGITGLRVRTTTVIYPIASVDACTFEYDGFTQDFVINILPPVPCTGMPSAGNAIASVLSVCPVDTGFYLIDTGYSNEANVSYQWISSPAGAGSFSPVAGSATPYFLAPSQLVATDYAYVATCATSGQSDTSAIVTVGERPFYLCYCSPLTGTLLNTDGSYATIDSVAIAGTAFNNVTPASAGIYNQYFPVTTATTDTLLQGGYYTLVLKSAGSDNYTADAWIDYDQSGTFDAGEYMDITDNEPSGTVSAVSFFVPSAAPAGLTGLRIRVADQSLAMNAPDACTAEYYGATADYVIDIVLGTVCSVSPVAGIAAVSVATVCPGVPFTLSDTGFAAGLSLSYQWLSATAGSGAFTAIPGATSPIYEIPAQSAATDYRFVVTCTATLSTDSSNIITVAETPYYNCYCNTSLGSFSYYTQIDSVNIPAVSFSLYSSALTPYIAFPSTTATATLQQLGAYAIDVNVAGGDFYDAGVWIDYDHSGVFEAPEFTPLATDILSGASSSAIVAIPLTAATGITAMRVRAVPSSAAFGAGDACTDYYYSQTYDFTITISPAPACSGTPVAGHITASSGSACSSSIVALTGTGISAATGLAIQWQSSPDSIIWADILGATASEYSLAGMTATTYFRLIVNCPASLSADTSNVVEILSLPCYCTPVYEAYDNTSGALHFFMLNGITPSAITDFIPSSALATGYVDRTGSVPPVNLAQEGVYSGLVTYDHSNDYLENQVWIDFNNNGIFESSETVTPVFGNYPGEPADSSVYSLTIPAGAATGIHRMRVRNAWMDIPAYITVSDPMDPCNEADAEDYYYSGITADYFVNIQSMFCDSISGFTAIPAGTSAFISWDISPGSDNYEYIVDASPATPSGSGAAITVASVNVTGLVPGSTYYAHVRRNCFYGNYSAWETIPVTTLCQAVTTPTVSAVTSAAATLTWTGVAGSVTYEYTVDVSSSSPSGAGTATAATTVNITGLTAGSTYYAHVRNECAGGGFSPWVTVPVITVCDTVTGLAVFSVLETSATVNWLGVPGSSIYQFVVNTTAGSPTGSGASLADTAVSFTGLVPGTLYYAHIRNSCPGGGFSAWETVSFTTLCDTVGAITVSSITPSSATITWDSVSGIAKYQYIIDNSPAAPTGAGTIITDTTITVTSLLPGTIYYAHVRDSCLGGGYASWTTIAFATFCDSVAGLTALSITDTSATVKWDSVAGSSIYQYVVNTSSVAPTGAGTVVADTTFGIYTLTPGTTYYAHVRNSCAGGGYSSWVTIPFTTSICDTVTSIAIIPGDSSVVFSWAFVSGSLGYYYVVDMSAAAPVGTGTLTSVITHTVTGLNAATTYYIHIRNNCGGGYSDWVTDTFTTLPPPCVISGLSVSGISDTGATITWLATPGAIDYLYVVDMTPGTPSVTGALTAATSATVTTLSSNSTYYAHVRVVCTDTSVWVTIPFTTLSCDTPALSVTGVTDSSITASWAAVPGAVGYQVTVDNSSAPPSSGTFQPGTVFTASPLGAGIVYYIHVRASCGGGNYSAWVTIEVSTSMVSVTNVNANAFTIQAFPNPATERIMVTVSGTVGDNRVIILTDVTGKELLRKNMLSYTAGIDMSELVPGIYLLKYEDNGHVQTIKVNKQ